MFLLPSVNTFWPFLISVFITKQFNQLNYPPHVEQLQWKTHFLFMNQHLIDWQIISKGALEIHFDRRI